MKRLITASIAFAVIVVGFALPSNSVEAAPVSISGYAWSENVGWVKFNGTNYGVSVESTNGNLSGYAWSEHFGWLSFNSSDTTGCPTNPCQPTVNLGNGALSGWAKWLATGEWLHLSGSGYGVTYNSATKAFSGYSWGDTFTGWLRWNGTGYGVVTDTLLSNEASISVGITPDTASWTVNPGSLQRTGDTSITVTPGGSGTIYTLTPGTTPSGYEANPVISNSQGGGSSITLFGGEEVSFTVTYQRSLDYSLSNGGSINISKGGGSYVEYGQTTITKTLSPTSGPTQAVDISVSGLPSGVSLNSIANNPCSPTCTSTITLAVSSSATAGTYPLTITGSPLGKTTNLNLVITNSPDLFVTCEATPSQGQVGQPITWSALVSQTPSEEPYTFYWTGTNVPTDPTPETQSFEIIYTTTGVKNANVLVADSKGNTATCNPIGSVNIDVRPIFEEF